MSNPKFYPRWIERGDGARIIVQNHLDHSAHMGEEFDEDANPVVKPAPPEPIQMPNPIAPAAPPPGEEDFPEAFYPPAAEKLPGAESQGEDAPFDLDTPIDLDPLGLFEPPTEAEAAETAAPRRRRKKTAETGA